MRRKRGLNSEPDIFVGFARLHIDELMRTDMRQTTTGLHNHYPLPRRTSLAKLLSRSLRALQVVRWHIALRLHPKRRDGKPHHT